MRNTVVPTATKKTFASIVQEIHHIFQFWRTLKRELFDTTMTTENAEIPEMIINAKYNAGITNVLSIKFLGVTEILLPTR